MRENISQRYTLRL